MGIWEAFLEISAIVFNVICWPSFTLLYPLFVSIRTLETNSSSKNQQCLTYWILFALITMLELTFVDVFKWFAAWPYVKGVATILLVTPYFGGASYVFKHLIRPYFIERIWNIISLSEKKSILCEAPTGISDDADVNRPANGPKLEKIDTGKGTFDHCYDNTKIKCTLSTKPKRVQKEWSCVICLIVASSEKCLKKHLRGKKHKIKQDELKANKQVLKATIKLSSVPNKAGRVVFLRNLNLESWGGLLNPVRSIRWCRWKKPEKGCIKLNTDGSVHLENAGFGGLFRDYNGQPLCAFVSKAPLDDIFLVELWAVWRGLVLGAGLGIKVIWVESDSLSVVKTINREQVYSMKSSSCLKQIWKLLTKFENYRVTHSWRETNRAADHMSRVIFKENDVVLWPVDFPDTLHKIIKDDAQGKIYMRR